MHNSKTVLFLALAIGLLISATALAGTSQAGGGISIPTAPITYNITLQINTECPLCQLQGAHIFQYTPQPYTWAAGKQFTLVIRDLKQVTSLTNVVLNATANSTGMVTFHISVSPTEANTNTTWEVALLVNLYGNYFLIFNNWYVNATFAQVIANLTGHYYTVLSNGSVVQYNYLAEAIPGGNVTIYNETNGALIYNGSYASARPSVGYYGPWGEFTYVNGAEQFANFTSAAIHQFYLGVTTFSQLYNLTLTKTLYINGALVATEPYKPVGTWTNGTYFGPIKYLGTYVTSLGGAGQNVTSFLSPSSVQYQFQVTLSVYNPNTGSYVTQTLITSTNNIYTTLTAYPNSTEFYVIETANFTRGYYTTTTTPANATCQQLVIWALPMSTLNVTGLYDIKGNPILSPEYFTFKVQENLGGYPLTISQAQGGWSTDITNVRFGFLHTLCGTISTFSDLVTCFNNLNGNRTKFAEAVFSIYRPVVLSWISGLITLTNSQVALSSVNLSPRLIVEYSYQATPFSGYQQPTSGYIDAVVLQAPLNASAPVNFAANLTVSILPVQIPLWWWNNATLPNGQPFNNLALAQSLTFIFSGTTAYLNETGQYAVVAGPWGSSATGTNQLNTLYFWALPPYEYVPITPGVYADLLTLVNASGYLPLPTLDAFLAWNSTRGYYFRYLSGSNTTSLSSLFSQYGLSISANQYTYSFRIYAGKILVGTANVVANYPTVYAINGTMVETQSNVAYALRAEYGPSGATEDAYTVQAINSTLQASKLSFYNLEHAINIAIHLVTTNILFKDFCGNVPSVVNGTISLTVSYNGMNFTLSQLPVAAEVPVTIPVAIDQWGVVLSKTATAYVTLNYFGYTLYGAPTNTAIPTSPVPITFSVSQAPYFKPVVYLPIAPATFKVMAAVWTENETTGQDIPLGLQYPLAGFVVVPYSTITGARMGESISNASGLAYFDELPLGVKFGVIVRTISPAVDMYWPFTTTQNEYGNSYSAYARWLGFNASDDVYTLGTRGPIDAGLVVNNTMTALSSCSATPILMEAQVYNPVFRIYDKTGQYLLSSQYVTPGPYPGAAPPILVNVTFVIADEFSPYNYSSRWANFTLGNYIVLTDFRIVGMTGMKSIFQNLAQEYLSAAQAAAGCTAPPTGNVSQVTADFAYAAMAGWLANASTNLYSAVFTLTSQQPKTGVPSICNLTASDVGVYDIAHLFLPGMRLHVKVWYMGYLVYDGYVTLTKPTVDIYTNVIPVNVTALTKDLRLPVNSYIGFTIANGYFGLALNSTYGSNFTGVNILKSLAYPFGFSTIGLKNLLVSATANGTPTLYNTRVWYNVTNSSSYFGEYAPVSSGADVVYLPDLVVLRNATQPLYMATVYNGTGAEYLASFDRWVELSYPSALLRSYDMFERNTFFNLLTLGDTPNATLPGAAPIKLPSFTSPASGVYTTTFWIYLYNSNNYTNLLNYRTLLLYLPWGMGTNATVYVTLTNVSNGATVAATYSLAKYMTLPQNLLPYEINLRNLALGLAPGYANVEVSVNVTVVYSSGPTTSYYSTPVAYLLKGVGVNATYANVTIGIANGQSVKIYYIVNLTAAGSAWSKWGGFGMPVTYVVKSGQIALLPAWADNTAAAGSYISRIWVIAAGSKEALCTTAPQNITISANGVSIVGYNFYGKEYLVVNYIPNSTPVTKPYVPVWNQTYLGEFGNGTGHGEIAGLGFPIGGTSSFAIANYLGVPVWNVTALYQAGMTSFSLPTTALDWLTVYNNASFPILVSGVTMICGSSSYTIPISGGYVYVPMYSQKSVALSDYGFGMSYGINASALWSLDTYVPQYNYSVTAYYGGIVDTLRHFLQDIQEQAARAQSSAVASELQSAYSLAQSLLTNYAKLIQLFNLQPLNSTNVPENVLYASYAPKPKSGWSYSFVGNVSEMSTTAHSATNTTAGTWGALTTNSSDYDFKYYFSFSELPLKYVLDWNARPLANQTVVLLDRHGRVYAIIYTTNTGQLAYDLPDISKLGHSDVVYVSWFDGYPLSVLTGNPAYLIWIYQQDVSNDVYQLGNASTTAQIRTYVYPATLTVLGPNGQPLANVEVQVYDSATAGAMFYFMGTTSASGAVTVYDRLVSSYPTGYLSQLPATNFNYEVLYPYTSSSAAAPADAQVWVPVATGTFSIQRGATVPSSGYAITSQVSFLTQLPISQPIGVSGYFTLQTSQGNLTIPFKTVTIGGTNYIVLSQPLPTSVYYKVQMTITDVAVNGVPIKLTTPFTTTFYTTAMPTSLDFASLGLVAPVTVQAVDGFGKLRTDWPVAIAINGQTVASGSGQVTAYLPLSKYVGQYTVTVSTTVKTPSGSTVVNSTTLAVSGPTTYVVRVPSGVISASVVDAFGTALSSSPIQIVNVATGTGTVQAEVLAGTYTITAQAYGYTWSNSTTVSEGQTANVQIVVPTARINAAVIDQVQGSIAPWTIQILGPSGAVATGTGTASAAVLAQTPSGSSLSYKVVATTPFGTYSYGPFTLSPGQVAAVNITVPTAMLQISAVDDNGYPINNLVSQVDVYYANGTLYKSFASAPVSVEVLGGQQYTIKVTAAGHVGSATITPPVGQVVAVRVTVPGTAGITIGGVRIPIPELVLWLVLIIVIVIIVAILLMEYSNWRRRRLMQILAPPK